MHRIAIVDPNEASRESLRTMLLGVDFVWLEAECARYDYFFDVIHNSHPDLVIVDRPGGSAPQQAAPKGAGQIISILGSRGGVGCTSIAVNLAATLAADPDHSVALIDLDLAMGDADIAIELPGTDNISMGDL